MLKIQPSEVSFNEIQEINLFKKAWLYLIRQDKLTQFFLMLRGLITIFALFGALVIFKSKDCFLWIIMFSNYYFVCAAGPAGLARFRFPIEVFWFIQAYYGFFWINLFWKNLNVKGFSFVIKKLRS